MTDVRRLFHRSEGTSPYDLAHALAADGHAEFYDGPLEASHLAFSLSKVGSGIFVHDDIGRHVATFADSARAVAHGFDHFDRPRRARRRAAKTKVVR